LFDSLKIENCTVSHPSNFRGQQCKARPHSTFWKHCFQMRNSESYRLEVNPERRCHTFYITRRMLCAPMRSQSTSSCIISTARFYFDGHGSNSSPRAFFVYGRMLDSIFMSILDLHTKNCLGKKTPRRAPPSPLAARAFILLLARGIIPTIFHHAFCVHEFMFVRVL
jgi:hypothetical protein